MNKQGYYTPVGFYMATGEAEDMVRLPLINRDGLRLGCCRVSSGLLMHARSASERFDMDARDIKPELEERKTVGGQEDMILERAVDPARRIGRGADGKHEGAHEVAAVNPTHPNPDGSHGTAKGSPDHTAGAAHQHARRSSGARRRSTHDR